MLAKLELTAAWAEEVGFSDADIANVFDIVTDSGAPESAAALCLQCRRRPVDHKIGFFMYNAAEATAERMTGRAFVNCVCGAWYSYVFADVMDSQTPVGQSHVPTPRTPSRLTAASAR